MSIIAKPYTFSPNTTASSSQVNSNFDTLYNDHNGGISAANLATDAVTTAKIADANVTTAKLADDSVDATKLSTDAILLGRASATSDFTTTSAGPVLVTGLSVTVTVPDFSRRLLITAYIPTISSAAAAPHVGTAQIWDGTVGSGTQLASAALYIAINSNNVNGCVIMAEIAAPSAGSKTYNVGLTIGSTNSKTITMSATSPGFIKVTAE